MAGNVAPIGSLHHNGIGHAGNKSFASYRVGHSVPGYTGYIPGPENVPIPVKRGVSEHTGRLRGSLSAHGNGGATGELRTEHGDEFHLEPGMIPPAEFKGRFLGAASRSVGCPPFVQNEKLPPKPFIAETTYTKEILDKENKLETRPGIHIAGTVRPGGKDNSNPFFVSEYTQKSNEAQLSNAHEKPQVPAMKVPLGSGVLADQPLTNSRYINIRSEPINSSYRQTYGAFGWNPRNNLNQHPKDINERASTSELFHGTSKSTKHLPGYSGFIPSSKNNGDAVVHGYAQGDRAGTKGFRLATLYQYPHNIPGYGGYRAQSVVNDADPKMDTSQTTSGRAASAGTLGFHPGQLGLSLDARAKTAPQTGDCGILNQMHRDFFSHAALSVSDNGVAEAELYFHKYRPSEGRSVAIIKQGHWNQY